MTSGKMPNDNKKHGLINDKETTDKYLALVELEENDILFSFAPLLKLLKSTYTYHTDYKLTREQERTL